MDWKNYPPRHETTPIYIPAKVAADFKRTLGTWEHFKHFEGNM